MGVLKNARHEKYCQGRISGMSRDEAYSEAGYSPDRANAGKLDARPLVQTRLQELQEVGAAVAVVTAAILSEQLEAMRKAALEAGQFGPAVQATMGRAKLHGLIIDKAQVEDVTPVKPEVRQAEIDRLLGKRHLRAVGS